ncbi:MAG: aminoacetone oxidase family FAD-binding enzyme [Mycoplasma sp.]
MNKTIHDVIIIGGGYSGSVLTYYLDENLSILMLENNKSILKKFLLTGKGYSNITNTLPNKEFLENVIGNKKFLYPTITKYNSTNILEWCDSLKIKYFEKTNNRIHLIDSNEKFRTILCEKLESKKNLEMKFNVNVSDIRKEGDHYQVFDSNGNTYYAKKVVMASGGLSFIKSDIFGSGYKIASKLNHRIEKTYPIGVGIVMNEDIFYGLQGTSVTDTTIKVLDNNNKVITQETGNLMVTHFGIGGPVVRRISGFISKYLLENKSVKINISFMEPERINAELNAKSRFFDCFRNFSKKMLFNIFEKHNLNHDLDLGNLSNKQRSDIIDCLTNNTFTINKTDKIQVAISTGGGVSLKEINPNSFESKNYRDLYFIGEILDLNLKSNGFNLTMCYATARMCADNINNKK